MENHTPRNFDFYDLAPVGYFTLSEQGVILEANLTAATLLETSRGDLITQPISSFICKDDHDAYYIHSKQLFETGEPQQCDLRLVKPDGTFIWAHLNATAAQAQDSTPVCYVALTDITEHKRAEEELKRFKTISDNAVYGKAIADLQGNLVYVNRFFAEMHGYVPNELIGKHLSLFHSQEQMRKENRRIDTLMREGHFAPTTVWHCHKDGTEFPMLMSGVLINDDYDNPQYIAASAIDMTAQHQAVAKLAESEKMLSRSQEIAHIGSWKLDLTNNRLTWTDEVYRIFGCKPQEFSPTYEGFLDFVHPEDRAAVDEAYSRSVREGNDSYDIEHRIVRRNSDEVRYVHERCVHERDDAGTIIQSTGMVQDITERKQAETYREMEQEIMQILNEPGEFQEFIQNILDVLKTRTGVDAVGIRMKEGDDFPYFVQDGFPNDFLRTENTLVERSKDGGLCRDKDGNISLECTCGLVISGKTDPSNPLFTKGGSCWTNDSFPMLDLPSDQDPRLHARNNCIHQGYASVALIPVRTSDRIVGLIQLNDKCKGRFTLETIQILESIAAHIGSALMRKQAEKQLAESEENLRITLNSIGDAVISTDVDGQVDSMNPVAESLTGWPENEAVGQPLEDVFRIINEQTRQTVENPVKIVLKKDRIVGLANHTLLVAKDGREIPIADSGAPIRNARGETTGVVLVFRDQTDERAALRALQHSQQRLESMFRAAPIGIGLVQERVIMEANQQMYQMTGYSAEELIGQNARMLYPSQKEYEHVGNEKYRQIEENGTGSVETVWQRKDGARINVLLSSAPRDPADPSKEVTFTAQDISERKQAETYREMGQDIMQILNEPGDIQESLQSILDVLKTRTGVDAVGIRMKEGDDFPYFVQDGFPDDFLRTENTLVERSMDGGVCRDKDGNISLECTCGLVISGKTDPSNPLFTKGGSCWTNDAFTLLDLPSDKDPRLHARNNCIHQGYASVALIPVRLTDQMYSRETCIRHGFSSMAQVPVKTSENIVGLIQLNDKNKGRFTPQTIHILENIAAHIGSALMRKQADQELQQTLDELQKTKQQVIEQERQKALTTMASGIAHDFNNALSPIHGFSELLLDNPEMMKDTEKVATYLEYIRKSASSAAETIRRMRKFYRPNENIKLTDIDLNTVITDAVSITKPRWKEEAKAAGKQIEIQTQLDYISTVKGNEAELNDVLTNLIFNAVDAMPEGGRITISTYIQNDNYVVLEFSDNGTGMSEETRQKCLDPFYTEKGANGSGLGLATVQGAVRRHNGELSFESAEGEGTTFYITLPLTESTQKTTEMKAHQSNGLNILVVDDEEYHCELLHAMLGADGNQVETASNGIEGIEKINANWYDLVITDRAMPEMNGDHLAAKIKEKTPDKPVIMLTGFGETMDAADEKPENVDVVISKPVTKKKLQEAIGNVAG